MLRQIFLTCNSALTDRFYYPQSKQYGMPPRHISPQSFDDILSELGADPAIPDPHGIRKSSAPPKPSQENQFKPKAQSFSIPALRFDGLKTLPNLIMGALLALSIAGMFFLLESNKVHSELELNVLQSQISTLKNELALAQSNWLLEQEDLYHAMDEIEVSIHSLNLKTPLLAPPNKPMAIPYEAELRRWRYLGLTRMGATEQAFFHTGKTIITLPKDGLALGEWRLSQAQKEAAILTHSKGKLITLRSTKSE
jgi:hypothetical protein